MHEPPILIEHIAATEKPKNRWSTVRVFFALTALAAIVITLLSSIPLRATIDFPMSKEHNLQQHLRAKGIYSKPNRFSWNEVSSIDTIPGWSVWLHEESILKHAEKEGYFCVITYRPVLMGFERSSATQSGTCDHGTLYNICTSCQSVLPNPKEKH